MDLWIHVHVSDDDLLHVDTPIVDVLIDKFLDFLLEHFPVIENTLVLDLRDSRSESAN